jgi:hypothetical protein
VHTPCRAIAKHGDPASVITWPVPIPAPLDPSQHTHLYWRAISSSASSTRWLRRTRTMHMSLCVPCTLQSAGRGRCMLPSRRTSWLSMMLAAVGESSSVSCALAPELESKRLGSGGRGGRRGATFQKEKGHMHML